MAKDSRKEEFSVEAALVLLFGGILAWGWLTTGPSNQELLANYAKAQDLANLATIESRF